ncbi:CIA30-domain-containing protein [Hypoxylon fragiforme]|uniref:CIA30-domain-containing protein n=1 Tax=Hypoxylon fragiforme TaxID=63214 RepID=UPI0020C5DC1D|nr:CIA30-domain-containing protein [Hypoxylon fragiforme]KAI2605412.1 CIA30-domain-containing protein [Hypoxylon fragiforme]
MRATTACLAKGFWARSLDEFKRLSHIALTFEAIKGPQGPLPLHDFHKPESLEECKIMCDADMGGFSQASLDWIASSPDNKNGHARFHGNISTALPPNKPDIQRSGYAAWRTLDRRATLFGRSLWDIDSYAFLALRLKSDGRSYFVNVQTDSIVPTDLHQHRLFAKRPGEWETVLINWNDFVRTNHGFVVEPQAEILRQRVRSIGLGLTDRVPGPFELCIERLWATNDMSEGDDHAAQPLAREGELKDKQGRKVNWNDN